MSNEVEITTEPVENEIIETQEETTSQLPDENSSVVSESNEVIEPVEEVAPYEANLTYNFRKESRQIPEIFKDIIKDEESNNLVKELFEKRDGLDFMKERRDHFRNELETFRTEVTPKIQKLEDFDHFLKGGDIAAACKVLGLTDEHIAERAIAIMNQYQNPDGPQINPDQAIQMREQERRNEILQAQLAQEVATKANHEFDLAITNHAPAINAYESKFGADTFKTMVSQYGQQQEQMGRNLTIQEAVNETIERYNLSSFAPQPVQPSTPVETPQPKEFPKIVSKTSSSSPVAKNIETFADLEKYSKSF
tara:strand:+ start:40008 stop:40934 length:927 start_codon:yes stop_codon:yes gene_type:complete